MPTKKTKTERPKPQLKNLDALFNIDEEETQGKLKIQEMPIENLIPFEHHPFRLYEGERLEDMVESIKANGVLVPIIARKQEGEDEAEILAGHNRINAAKLAGHTTIPAIILEGISEDEAMVYVVETNLIQRSFSDMTHSEKAAVIAMHHNKMFSQGKRNDILEQLKALENPDAPDEKVRKVKTKPIAETPTSTQSGSKLDGEAEAGTGGENDIGQRTTEKIGALYSLSRNTIARYLRINRLKRALKAKLDSGVIPFIAAVEISFFFLDEQDWLAELLDDGFTINASKAAVLRQLSKEKTLDKDTMTAILAGQTANPEEKPRKVNVSGATYSRYFKPEQSPKEVEAIVEEALAQYFSKNGGGAS